MGQRKKIIVRHPLRKFEALIFKNCLTRCIGIKMRFISNEPIGIRITNNFVDNYSTRYRFLHIFLLLRPKFNLTAN